jgi:hypothetical protein
MHYVTHGSHQIQKHKFGVMCHGVLFMEIAPGPPEHEKCCVDISRLGLTGMHYVTHRSQWMQKHKFSITCPGAFLSNLYIVHPGMRNSVSMFHSPDTPKCTT